MARQALRGTVSRGIHKTNPPSAFRLRYGYGATAR